ncbi:MAG TPA: GntR family transcriptional regulator [Rhizobiaceae bacterium]|nr:GntR family transcriptional regulator [Rhizobiaceae bacterium]
MKQTPRKSLELRREIEHDILAGHFRPGDRLDEQSLADRFQVSRTPIREALQQLQFSGLVVNHPNRGAFVAQVSASEILEMCELRVEMESICGRFAANRGTSAAMVTLARALQACEAAADGGDVPAYLLANDQFHDAIYVMTGNKLLAEAAGSLYHRLKFFRHLKLVSENRIQRSLAEHRAIVAAITSRDAALAETLLKQHAVTRSERLVQYLASLSGDELERREVG